LYIKNSADDGAVFVAVVVVKINELRTQVKIITSTELTGVQCRSLLLGQKEKEKSNHPYNGALSDKASLYSPPSLDLIKSHLTRRLGSIITKLNDVNALCLAADVMLVCIDNKTRAAAW